MRSDARVSWSVRGATAIAAAYACAATHAAALHVNVVDDRGRPVEGVAVYAEPSAVSAAAPVAHAHAPPPAEMDQANNEFVPHVLVVEQGTEVLFPNNDSVSHHVYSFSPAKPIEHALYKGNVHPPLIFDRAGVNVLGCNIHDGMLGYIVVVATPHFAQTDAEGRAALAGLPPGDYRVSVWTPRLRGDDLPAQRTITVGADDAALTFDLEGKLLPRHDHGGGSGLSWQRY